MSSRPPKNSTKSSFSTVGRHTSPCGRLDIALRAARQCLTGHLAGTHRLAIPPPRNARRCVAGAPGTQGNVSRRPPNFPGFGPPAPCFPRGLRGFVHTAHIYSKNTRFCVTNHGLVQQNARFCVPNHGFCIAKSEVLCSKPWVLYARYEVLWVSVSQGDVCRRPWNARRCLAGATGSQGNVSRRPPNFPGFGPPAPCFLCVLRGFVYTAQVLYCKIRGFVLQTMGLYSKMRGFVR